MRLNSSRLSAVGRAALFIGLFTTSAIAQALDVKLFSAELLANAQKADKPVAVHFHADWCPTCRKQATALERLKADKSLDTVTVLIANYDAERDLRRSMQIRTQSTLVVFKGTNERARLAGESDETKLATALRSAL
jgi:thiol-disulfide isomerase/thioredoxin